VDERSRVSVVSSRGGVRRGGGGAERGGGGAARGGGGEGGGGASTRPPRATRRRRRVCCSLMDSVNVHVASAHYPVGPIPGQLLVSNFVSVCKSSVCATPRVFYKAGVCRVCPSFASP
jgi:hypothetical protein